jgi:hypothetical protein
MSLRTKKEICMHFNPGFDSQENRTPASARGSSIGFSARWMPISDKGRNNLLLIDNKQLDNNPWTPGKKAAYEIMDISSSISRKWHSEFHFG